MVLAASELCSENAFPRTVAAIRRVALITAQRAIATRLCSALRLGYTAVTAYALAGTELPDLWSSDTHRSRGAYSHTRHVCSQFLLPIAKQPLMEIQRTINHTCVSWKHIKHQNTSVCTIAPSLIFPSSGPSSAHLFSQFFSC